MTQAATEDKVGGAFMVWRTELNRMGVGQRSGARRGRASHYHFGARPDHELFHINQEILRIRVAAPFWLRQRSRMPRTRRKVALVIETSNAYARDLLHGVRSWVREHGAWAMRLTEHGRGADVPGWLQDWRGDGIIARVENEAIAAALKATKLPVVDVSAALPQPRFPRVITDSRAVTQLAAAHLIERGFKHFGYCGEPRFLWAHQRAGYFKDHLRQAGFECSVFTPANRSNRAGRMEKEVLAIARWLRGLP